MMTKFDQDFSSSIEQNNQIPPAENVSIKLSDLTREPELVEKFLIYLERRNLFQSMSISVKVSSETELASEKVFFSLRNLVLKYPMLFMFPEGEEPDIKWEPLSQIKFSDVFSENSDITTDFAESESCSEVLTKVSIVDHYKQHKPLWKLVYYPNIRWLTFHCAHSFTDGGSVVAYLKDLVEGFNDHRNEEDSLTNGIETSSYKKKSIDIMSKPDPGSDKHDHISHEKDNAFFLSSKSQLLFDLKSDLHLLKNGIPPQFFDRINYQPNLSTRVFASALKAAIQIYPGIVPNVLEPLLHDSMFVNGVFSPKESDVFLSEHIISEQSPLNNASAFLVKFSPKTVDDILLACRKHKVKLQTYLIIAYIHTIHESYPKLYSEKSLKIGVAASLRNRFPGLSNHSTYLGNRGRFDDGFYSYVGNYYIEPHTSFSWTTVKKYHDFLHSTVNSPDWITQYYVAGRALTAESYMSPKLEKQPDNCFMTATNLGNIDLLAHEDRSMFQIEDILFAPCIAATFGTHHMTSSSTKMNGLNVMFTKGDRNIKDWGVFRENFESNLKRFSMLE